MGSTRVDDRFACTDDQLACIDDRLVVAYTEIRSLQIGSPV